MVEASSARPSPPREEREAPRPDRDVTKSSRQALEAVFSRSGGNGPAPQAVQYLVTLCGLALSDCLSNELFCSRDGLWQRKTARKVAGDGGGAGAACAVGGDAPDEGRPEQQFLFAIVKNIDGFIEPGQMATLDQHGAAKFFVQFPGGGAQVFSRAEPLGNENLGLVQIWGE